MQASENLHKSSPRNHLNHNNCSPDVPASGAWRHVRAPAASLLQGLAPPAPARPPVKVRSARSRNRAAAWAYDIAQQHQYARAMARSDEELVEIDIAYEAELAAGPDFARYHVGSAFAEAPEHRLNREEANKVLVAFDVARSGMFRHCRVPRRPRAAGQGTAGTAAPRQIEQAAPPSRNYREVLRVLLRYAVRFGRVYPKLETIARDACVSVRTVQNAIDWLRRFGFVDRIRRVVRERGQLGGVRCRQTSNAYRVGFPTGLGRLAQSVFRRIVYATDSRAATTRNTCDPSGSPSSPIMTDPLGEGFGKKGFQCEGALL